MDVIFEEGDTSKKTSAAIDDMKEITGEKGCYVGMAVQDKSVAKNVRSEMQMILVIGVFMIFLVLCLTTNSWVEPFLYLTVMGVAVVINKGTNLFLGEISFLTNSVSAVLQLAVSMDYSIFLIHAFTRYKKAGMGQTEALRAAIDEALNSIFASSLTTIVGFIVLVFMRFSIGYDMGIVLAKGIVCSLLTVVLFMPAMIIRLAGWMERTAHRPFLPEFDRLSRGIYRVRYLVLAVVAVLVLPAYTAQGMNSYMYGNDAVGAGEGTEVYADEQEIDRIFGRSNMMMALVPSGDNVREREFSQELSDLPYTKTVMSLSQTLPEGVPESFLPESVTGLLHDESGWSRILIYVRSKGESEAAFRYADEISAIMKEYYPGESYLVGATPSTVSPASASDTSLTWTSSNKKVATVDKNGKVKGVKKGTATITVKTANGQTADCKITVSEVTLNAKSFPLQVRKSTTALEATVSAKGDSVKSWKSSNTKIATVNSKGKITAKKTGTAKITVTTKSGATATCTVKVQKGKVTTKSLSISKKKLTLQTKKSTTLTLERNPISATEKITWTSSNTKVATVNSKGKVTAKKAGTTTITARTSNGKKVTCKVTVRAPKVTLRKTSASIKVGNTAAIRIKSTYPAKDEVKSYKSSNKKVATVNRNGKVTGVKKGKATITVTMKSGAKATFKVTVK